jgi:hypothetical protein
MTFAYGSMISSSISSLRIAWDIAISAATTAACLRSAQLDQFPAQLAAGLPTHQPACLYHSYFPSKRQLLFEQLVQWLMQAEKRFRGTLDFTYALTLLCEEASLLRYSSDHFALSWYPAGISIIEQGEQANSLYLILSGSVDVICEAEDGSMEMLARLEAGAFLGEEGLARRAPRHAHVVAAENVTCQVFSPEPPTAFLGRGEGAHLGSLSANQQTEGLATGATTRIDVGQYLQQKSAAIAAHRSQYAMEAEMLPLAILQELMGWEYFICVYPAPEIETELLVPAAVSFLHDSV